MSWAPNPGQYAIDLRLISAQVLDWILISDNPKLTAASAGNSRSVRDFCEQDRNTEDHQRSFSGRNLRTRLDVDEIGGSPLHTHRGYSIQDDRCYPGSVQNLILPRFNKRWDNAPISGKLEAFRWKILERLRPELRDQPTKFIGSASPTPGPGRSHRTSWVSPTAPTPSELRGSVIDPSCFPASLASVRLLRTAQRPRIHAPSTTPADAGTRRR